ncbi:homoserine kinase, partial [Candidatus Bathyarchaeota archaeon]|nr:homoserine kinase [Candidatus Bathyarchaeota archaeon]
MISIRLKCPATTANLGAGFDIFGLALKEPYDVIEVEKSSSGIEIQVEGYDVPKNPEGNTGGYVALRMIRDFAIDSGVKLRIIKRIKPGSGLGSSAATAAGAAYALNEIFQLNLSLDTLVEYASLGEIVSAGAAHADNVAPALYGGFTIIASRKPLKVLNFKPPEVGIVVALPHVEKGSTRIAREVIPKHVPLEHVVRNIAYASTFVAGMISGNVDLIKMGMNDCIVEPARAEACIFRGFTLFKEAGVKIGAGVAASGAGPAVIGLIEKHLVD